MIDREKVLAGLKCCLEDHDCILCPYDDVDSPFDECTHALFQDVREVLLSQPAIVTTITQTGEHCMQITNAGNLTITRGGKGYAAN